MAKMFYTLEETKGALSLSEEEVKDLVRQTRLREFRDGPRLMFKADQVETLKAELGASRSGSDLGPSDSGAPLGLADSRGPSGTGTSLTLSDDSAAGGKSPGGGLTLKDDTALAADLGLSGSLGGMPSPTRLSPGGGSGSGLSGLGSGVGGRSGSGVSVFNQEEVDHADPSAQTAISSGSGMGDAVSVEGVGSGSGLLDLTRERDDTSLGAELLDEISPSGRTRAGDSGAGVGGSGTISSLSEPRGGVTRTVVTPTYVEAPDSLAPALGGFALGAAAFIIFGLFVLVSAVVGHYPPIVKQLGEYNLWALAGGGIGLAVLFFIVGLLFGKAGARR